jgi:hypothetical protein
VIADPRSPPSGGCIPRRTAGRLARRLGRRLVKRLPHATQRFLSAFARLGAVRDEISHHESNATGDRGCREHDKGQHGEDLPQLGWAVLLEKAHAGEEGEEGEDAEEYEFENSVSSFKQRFVGVSK